MALNQEENFSSGIKFDSFLERCQNTERENPKGFDNLDFDNVYEDVNDFLFDDSFEIDTNFPGDFFGVGRKIGSLDAAIIRCIEAFDTEFCGFKTKETPEAMKVDDNKKVASVGSTLGFEEWSYEGCNALGGNMEDFLPFGFDKYWKSSCNLAHERKGLEKDGTRVGKDCANTSSPNYPNMEDFLPFGFDKYWKSSCNLAHERKGLEKDGTRAGKDCANTSSPNNPLELDVNLPRDPFGMDYFESITCWIEDFGSKGHVLETKEKLEAKKVASVGGSKDELGGYMDDYIKFRFDKYWFPQCYAALKQKWLDEDCIRAEKDVTPPDGLFFDLGYLGSVEVVCKLPCDAVQNDPLPWRNIHIDHPLNDKITDDDLLRITNRAQGTLHSLSLVECRKITAAGLRRIFLSNPGLSEVVAVLNGETMIVNKEGYIGYFMERRPGIRIDLNLPADDSQSETSNEDTADDSASD